MRELLSVVDYGREGPSIDPIFGAVLDGYWSSTTTAANGGWTVEFGSGDSGEALQRATQYVRALRS